MFERLSTLTTAHLADACIRLGVEVRCAPSGLRPLVPGMRVAGRARPVRHVGSVDVFLEAISENCAGDVLVVDNGGRLDESCVGDIVALELQQAGFAGVLIWGLHRDTADLEQIGLPLFSLGATPAGPRRLDPRPADAMTTARIGSVVATTMDLVVADEDGAIFFPLDRMTDIILLAEKVRDRERGQAARMREGESFRAQVGFRGYLARRAAEPDFSFRAHLRAVGGAVEE